MVNATFLRSGVSANVNPKTGRRDTLFIYKLSGPASEIAEFQAWKGAYARSEGETALYITKFIIPGGKAPLVKSTNGNWYPDTSQFEMARATVEAMGGNLGQSMGDLLAKQLLAGQGLAAVTSNAVEDDIPAFEEEEIVEEVVEEQVVAEKSADEEVKDIAAM